MPSTNLRFNIINKGGELNYNGGNKMNAIVSGYIAGLAIGALIGFGLGWMLRGLRERRKQEVE